LIHVLEVHAHKTTDKTTNNKKGKRKNTDNAFKIHIKSQKCLNLFRLTNINNEASCNDNLTI